MKDAGERSMDGSTFTGRGWLLSIFATGFCSGFYPFCLFLQSVIPIIKNKINQLGVTLTF